MLGGTPAPGVGDSSQGPVIASRLLFNEQLAAPNAFANVQIVGEGVPESRGRYQLFALLSIQTGF